MLVRDLRVGEGLACRCPYRTHTFSRREPINAFGADTPLANIGLRYRCGRCDIPAHDAWITWPGVMRRPERPVVYYGGEIGTGDNPFLDDDDGVRTPMQWSADRSAGFSRTDPVALHLPPVADPLFGHQAVNVEQQRRMRASLLNWMRWVCAANLSGTAQATALDSGAWVGCVPVDLFGGCAFPPVGRQPYPAQLTGHGFYRLELVGAEEARANPARAEPP